MKYFICYFRSSIGSKQPVVMVTDSESAKDSFLTDAFNADIDDATYKIIELD